MFLFSLLDRNTFYSQLNLEDITDKDYAHGQKVWEVFEIKNRGEYHDLYVQCDALLLADVFENFSEKCFEICEPDPAHFVSALGLAWQACIKKTEVKLELITDYDMFMMVEERIRDGMCQAIYRYAKANKKYMNNYDKRKIISYLRYLDVNTLLVLAMSHKLPLDGFKWVKDLFRFNEDFIRNYDENSNERYFLELDVEYPKKLYRLHKDFPFLPKKEKIDKCEKLVCNIKDKEIYAVHIRALKQALNHGLKPKKVHRVIQFNQEVWLKPYIDMNTKLRKEAKNDFEKIFFKLMNNSVFGKTMGNMRDYRYMKLTTNRRRKRLVSEPNYHTQKHFQNI